MADAFRDTVQRLRRRQLLDAAASVFSTHGFHVATMRQVADAAGVAHGTVYNYFSSKDELLVALLDRLNETEVRPAQFEGLQQGDLEGQVAALIRHRLAHLSQHRAVLQAVLPEVLANSDLRDRYLQAVVGPSLALAEAALAEGCGPDVSAAHLVRGLAGSVLGVVILDLLGDDVARLQAAPIADLLARCFVRGGLS